MREVAIYIYIDELIDDVLTPIAHRLELFEDENISITSSMQKFNDLGAIFTDYSQTFTIPAAQHNNKIFKHWYESAVSDGFDHRISYYGFIEIDKIPFRYGKFQLVKANAKNGKIESYSVNFVGNLIQIRDRFKDDEIGNILIDGVSPYDELNFDYTAANCFDIFNGSTTYPYVAFPLIGNNRRYMCGDGGAYDITTVSGAIDVRELFPAIPVWKILEYIQSAYGLTFTGVFLDSVEFKNLWLYCKNSEEFKLDAEGELVQCDDAWTYNDTNKYDNTTYTLTFQFINSTITRRIYGQIDINPAVGYTDIPYTVEVYNNGILQQSFNNIGSVYNTFFDRYINDEVLINGEYPIYNYTFKVKSDLPIVFDAIIRYRSYTLIGGVFGWAAYDTDSAGQSTSSLLNIKNYIPKIKVLDFVTGLIKMHNLMIVPFNETSFEFVPMEQWYSRGETRDITRFIDRENIDINRPNLFRKVAFMYEKSTNILNNAFRNLFKREYADLDYESVSLAYSENYEVKLPFENIMFEKYPVPPNGDTTTFITATCWDKDLNPYVPKPVLLYLNGVTDLLINDEGVDIKLIFGASDTDVPNYLRFSNEVPIGATDISLIYSTCWGSENSVWDVSNVPTKGLYERYYANYIENLYNISTRVLNYKFIAPSTLLTDINLYDKIIVDNKRYVINKYTANLVNGEVQIELLNDYRTPLTENSVGRNTNIGDLVVDNTAQTVKIQVFLKDQDLWRGKVAVGFLSTAYSFGTNYYEDGILTVNIPANATAADRNDNILIEYFKGMDSFIHEIPVLQYA